MLKHLRGQPNIIGGLLVALLVLTACGGSNSPAVGNQAPAASAPSGSGNLNAGQIVISGAISKTYTPIKVEAGKLMDRMVINLNEKTVGGVSLQFPADTQPGTYPIEDHLNKPVVDVFGEYDVFGGGGAFYLSTNGTLTLTAVGSKFSGRFQFTAGHNKDASKTIEVTGSFTDVPFNSN